MCDIVSFPRESANQVDNSCSSLPAELGGIGEFETKFEEICKKIWEEIIQNEVNLGGSPTINVTLELGYNFGWISFVQNFEYINEGFPYIIREDIKHVLHFGQE